MALEGGILQGNSICIPIASDGILEHPQCFF
jgi:hypothetical protein